MDGQKLRHEPRLGVGRVRGEHRVTEPLLLPPHDLPEVSNDRTAGTLSEERLGLIKACWLLSD